jgi:hypothetical protein
MFDHFFTGFLIIGRTVGFFVTGRLVGFSVEGTDGNTIRGGEPGFFVPG